LTASGGGIEVRAATSADVPAILAFIEALAAYEKLSHEVRATQADLARDLFGPDPKVFCDLAWRGDAPVGFAVWFHTYSTFVGAHGIYLEDLFVTEAARGTGAGLALMRNLARRCATGGFGRLEWAVLDWNTPALDFYAALGASAPDGWLSRRLDGAALKRLAEA